MGAIMARFSTRRGRPRTRNCAPDKGTPELRKKRAETLTSEAIDLCYRRGLITERAHRHALHFRWLYTIRFGAPAVQALDISQSQHGRHQTTEDSPWRIARQQEYRQAAMALEARNALVAVLRVAVFDDPTPLKASCAAEDCLRRLQTGLSILDELWRA